jgi:hypothetical protein
MKTILKKESSHNVSAAASHAAGMHWEYSANGGIAPERSRNRTDRSGTSDTPVSRRKITLYRLCWNEEFGSNKL